MVLSLNIVVLNKAIRVNKFVLLSVWKRLILYSKLFGNKNNRIAPLTITWLIIGVFTSETRAKNLQWFENDAKGIIRLRIEGTWQVKYFFRSIALSYLLLTVRNITNRKWTCVPESASNTKIVVLNSGQCRSN